MTTAPSRILLIQGHPDRVLPHFGHALADAYEVGARYAGSEVRRVNVAELNFPLLSSEENWKNGALPDSLLGAQQDINWANHIVLFFPLWLGDMPALLKGFLEQVLRPTFAFESAKETEPFSNKRLKGRSARVVVTMGMPALVYRWYFRAHSVKALERNILGFVGISPVRETLIGGIGGLKEADATQWLEKLHQLGRDKL
jgi:putative NADPH-quinone reductase